jgi:hypothetical protein
VVAACAHETQGPGALSPSQGNPAAAAQVAPIHSQGANALAALPKVPEGQGRIYVYGSGVFGSENRPALKVNGAVVGACVRRHWLYKDVPAGNYQASLVMEGKQESRSLESMNAPTTTSIDIAFTLGNGEEKFFKCSGAHFKQVGAAEGRRGIEN